MELQLSIRLPHKAHNESELLKIDQRYNNKWVEQGKKTRSQPKIAGQLHVFSYLVQNKWRKCSQTVITCTYEYIWVLTLRVRQI